MPECNVTLEKYHGIIDMILSRQTRNWRGGTKIWVLAKEKITDLVRQPFIKIAIISRPPAER